MIESGVQPSIDESANAVVKAVGSRRARHRADPARAHMTASAVAERVTGVTLPPRPGRDGWWLVGRVLDDIDDIEYSVWFLPESRRVGLSRRERPAVIAPTPPADNPYYYDGLRRKWIDTKTGEVVADAVAMRGDRRGDESGRRTAT